MAYRGSSFKAQEGEAGLEVFELLVKLFLTDALLGQLFLIFWCQHSDIGFVIDFVNIHKVTFFS